LIARGSTPRVFFNNPEKFFVLTLSFQAKLFNCAPRGAALMSSIENVAFANVESASYDLQDSLRLYGQVNKRIWRMPWR